MLTTEIIVTSPSVTIGTDRVDSEASTTAPVTRRMVDVLSCEVESQRLYRSLR